MIEGMRKAVPGITLRTTFITGFPGETDEEFEEMLSFVKEARFDNLGAFAYSPEPGSGAEPLGDPVPAEVKEERKSRLLAAQQPIAKAKNRERKGKTFDALLEGPCADTDLLLEGRIAAQAPEIDGRLLVNRVPDGWEPRVGEIVRVKVTKSHEYDLVGTVL